MQGFGRSLQTFSWRLGRGWHLVRVEEGLILYPVGQFPGGRSTLDAVTPLAVVHQRLEAPVGSETPHGVLPFHVCVPDNSPHLLHHVGVDQSADEGGSVQHALLGDYVPLSEVHNGTRVHLDHRLRTSLAEDHLHGAPENVVRPRDDTDPVPALLGGQLEQVVALGRRVLGRFQDQDLAFVDVELVDQDLHPGSRPRVGQWLTLGIQEMATIETVDDQGVGVAVLEHRHRLAEDHAIDVEGCCRRAMDVSGLRVVLGAIDGDRHGLGEHKRVDDVRGSGSVHVEPFFEDMRANRLLT